MTNSFNPVRAGTGLLIAGFAFLGGRKLLRELRYRGTVTRTDNPGSPQAIAQQIQQAFYPDTPFGLGTDTGLLREAFLQIPHRQFFREVERSYRKLTKGRELMADMQGELGRSEFSEFRHMLDAMPRDAREAKNLSPDDVTPARLKAWAGRIKAAADYEWAFFLPYGTDTEAIYQVLRELPTAKTLCQLNDVYRQHYGKSVVNELSSELTSSELIQVYQIIMNKPDSRGKKITQVLASCA